MFDANKFRCETRNYLVKDYLCNNLNSNFKTLIFSSNSSWFTNRKSLVIESILLRISIGEFWFYEDVNNNLVCIDGEKRLEAVQCFMQEGFSLKDLTLRSDLNNLTFSTLSRAYQRRIEETCLSINYITSGTSEEYREQLITRLRS